VRIASRTRRQNSRHEWIALDVCDAGSVEKAFSALPAPLNILVNCAGSNLRNRVEDLSTAEWESSLRANLTGAFLLAKHALPGLREGGWSRFVQVNSVLAKTAVEWAPYQITANSISPGPFLTDTTKGILADPAAYRKICERIPVGRFGDPAEIATACLFLCSRGSSYVTGTDILVDGGWSAA
jgi:NAD(P)-dependent dehydrogenase (short-subunit alcohol dehydrogenase family)